MSDFLSNFDKKNYKKTVDGRSDKAKEEPVETQVEPKQETISSRRERQRDPEEYVAGQPYQDHAEARKWAEVIPDETADEEEGSTPEMSESALDETKAEGRVRSSRRKSSAQFEPELEEEYLPSRTSRGGEEETEVDPTYQKRQRRKIILISAASIIGAIALFLIFYFTTHTKMPNFNEKNIGEAREWATEYKMKLDLKQEYDFKNEVNTVTSQSVKAGKQVKKKGNITITASLGPDPEEVIPLPDFAKMSKTAADEWVAENKAENLSILEEYSDTVEKTKFVRQEINNKEVTAETYKRQDQAIVYFSKGKEVFEKDIAMPDFRGKPKSDVETWVKTNEIKMEYKKVDSDKVEAGLVVAQEIDKGKKIAKRDAMSVSISTGPAVIVPDFSEYNPETAATIDGLTVNVKSVFSTEAGYGQLLYQSVEAGTKVSVSEKEPTKITVTYSAGRPYLRSYFGELEGDLDKSFYEDYRSKGAQVYFYTYYVDSSETKGTVVKMDTYNEYIPIEFTVGIGISNGSGAGTPSGQTDGGGKTNPSSGDGGSGTDSPDSPDSEGGKNGMYN